MKKIFLALALTTFVGSIASTAYAAVNGVEVVKHDDKKKKKKKKAACCASQTKASCSSTQQKACCSKKSAN
jgi:hypothetical protein